MKKTICALLVALLAFSAIACDGNTSNAPPPHENPPASGETLPEEGGETNGGNTDTGDGETVYYVVTFDSCGGSDVAPASVLKGGLVEEPTPPKKSSKEGEYEFIGWYLGDKAWDFTTDTVVENVTLTAKWKVVEAYTPPFLPKD